MKPNIDYITAVDSPNGCSKIYWFMILNHTEKTAWFYDKYVDQNEGDGNDYRSSYHGWASAYRKRLPTDTQRSAHGQILHYQIRCRFKRLLAGVFPKAVMP